MAASPHDKLTVEQLKAECKKHELKFSSRAKKTDLLKLLDGHDKLSKLTVDDLSKKLKEHAMPATGTKAELIKRLVRYDEYSALTLPQVKAVARSKGSSDQGTKEEIMVRLLQKPPKQPHAPAKPKAKGDKKAEKAEKPAGADQHAKPAPRLDKKGRPAPQIKIASWNLCNLVEQSRHKKYNVIAQLFEDYDVVAVQEVIHKEGLDEIKKLLPGWDYVSSHSSVGRIRKEFYAFFYRSERIQVVASGQFDDTAKDVFEREPFVATFKVAEGHFDFTLISIHVLWGNSVVTRRQELTHFAEVIKAVLAQNKGEKDIMLMGDFNFGPEDQGWSELKALGYKPVILPPEKTTVGSVSLFDNIWLSEKNTTGDWTGESGVVHWDETMYGKETLKARNEVSDHRPVWATFYTMKDEDDGTSGKLEGLKI